MVTKIVPRLIVGILLLVVWKLAWDYLEINPEPPVRAVGDIWDMRTYYNHGKWFPERTQPYIDVPSEYPQVATYLFGLVHWFSRNELRAGAGREIYFHVFSLIMLGFAYLNFVLVSNMLESRKWLALVLFLPGPLYYTLYRFDILPALLCLLAVYFARKRYWNTTSVLLGVATLTKWYPILLIPPLLAHIWSVERKVPWKPVLCFLVTCIVIVVPTILGGGINALLAPYQYHSGRSSESASLPGYLISLTAGFMTNQSLIPIFLGLQVVASAVSFFIVIESHQQFENWLVLIIGCFILFSRIFSPQWILWVLPLLILTSRNTLDISLVVAYGILGYLGFPIAYDLKPSILPVVSMIGLLPLFILVIRYATRVDWRFAYSSIFQSREIANPQL